MRRVELGPTGNTVADNVLRFRKGQGLTLRQLADRMAEAGRPITHTAVSDIEKRARRVDADDLVALAVVLGVSPSALLVPATSNEPSGSAAVVEVTGAGPRAARDVWDWLRGHQPIRPDDDPRVFRAQSLPLWLDTLDSTGITGKRGERRRGNN